MKVIKLLSIAFICLFFVACAGQKGMSPKSSCACKKEHAGCCDKDKKDAKTCPYAKAKEHAGCASCGEKSCSKCESCSKKDGHTCSKKS
ncbi:MAG: hypothetical protein KDD56_02895 [Bdellovibrionales bacterium]|nr:hypothetical protein [Bdellovibrionales bacterium]